MRIIFQSRFFEETKSLEVPNDITVKELKFKYLQKIGFYPSSPLFNRDGLRLEDREKISIYGIKDGDTIFVEDREREMEMMEMMERKRREMEMMEMQMMEMMERNRKMEKMEMREEMKMNEMKMKEMMERKRREMEMMERERAERWKNSTHTCPYGCERQIPNKYNGCRELLEVYPNYFG